MIILDTNVLSELMRPAPSAGVLDWFARQPALELFTTTITEAEVFYGLELLPRSKRSRDLRATAEVMFAEDFAGRIFAFDSAAARALSEIAARRRSLGNPISFADAQIAAITQVRGAKLATRNAADFRHCDIDVIDPWTA